MTLEAGSLECTCLRSPLSIQMFQCSADPKAGNIAGQCHAGIPVFNFGCISEVTERGNPCQVGAVCNRRPVHDFDGGYSEVLHHSATR